MTLKSLIYGFLLCPYLAFCPAALCQADLTIIRGKLTQVAGSPLDSGRVVAISLSNGKRYSTVSDRSGQYIINDLPADNYKMRFEAAGFKPYSEEFIPTVAGLPTEVNVRLADVDSEQVSGSSATEPSILKIDRADVSTTFTRQEIERLPIYNQNLSRLELLVPGALRSPDVLVPFQNPQQSTFVNLNGQRFSGSGFTLDGVINRDPLEGLVVVIPSVESVAGMRVTTQNYSAEYGEATAGFISVQTLSGTNTWHGGAYGYRQTGFGQASEPDFGNSSFLIDPSQRRANVGGSAGGPLIRNRLYVFGDYRGVRRSSAGSVLLTVPTPTIHRTCTGNPSDSDCDLSAYTAAGAICAKTVCTDGNGLIPNTAISPQMIKFLGMIPMPNFGPQGALTNNFIKSGVESLDSDSFDVRADYAALGRLRIFARYISDRFRQHGSPAFGVEVGGLGINPDGFAGRGRSRNEGIATGFSYAVTPSILADFRFGLIKYKVEFSSPDANTNPAIDAGINGLNLGDRRTSGMPDFQLDNPDVAGLPIAGNSDFLRFGYSPAANGCNCPFTERERQFQWVTNWTKTSGSHVLKWGADIRYLQNFRLSSDSRPAGHLEFGFPFRTGFSLSDFLTGRVGLFDRTYNNPQNPEALNAGERQKRMFFYGEDTWRVSSRLSISYGLRWELYLPQYVTGTAAGGWLQLGSGSSPFQDSFLVAGEAETNLHGGVRTTFRNFGPRVGLAYLVNPKAVIRAGYGRAFDPGYAGTIFGIAATQSPPVSVIATPAPQGQLNLNSNAPGVLQVCAQTSYPPPAGVCDVPRFKFPSASLSVDSLYSSNFIPLAPTAPHQTLPPTQQANLYALPRRLRLPTVDAWNLAVQEQLDRHTYLELSYVANKGTHVLNDSTGGNIGVPYYDLNESTLAGFIAPEIAGAANCQGKGTTVQMDAYCKTPEVSRQPFYPWRAQVRYFGNDASSSYNSLQVRVRRLFASGYSMLAHYTWSKVLDFDNLYYALDPRISRGVGNFDRKHNFAMTNILDLPVGRKHRMLGDAGPALDRIVGGWSLAAATSWSSGLPFTPGYLDCVFDVGTSPYAACRPNMVGSVHVTGDRHQYFTTTGGLHLQANCVLNDRVTISLCNLPVPAIDRVRQGFNPTNMSVGGVQPGQPILGQTLGPWQRPGAGQIGNAGRNSLRGPGFFQSDLAVAKNIQITERLTVIFRADVYNLFNKVNFANPNPIVDSPFGGEITSIAFGAVQRQMQFSIHAEF